MNTDSKENDSCNYRLGKHMRDALWWGLGLGAVFFVLRLTGVIGWSWWAVTAPLWSMVSSGILAAITSLFVRNRTGEEMSAYFGLSGILNIFVVFLVLRALGVIDWAWGIIAIPLWPYIGLTSLTAFGYAMKKRHDKQKDAAQ